MSRGVSVGRFDLCTTPAMFMSCVLPEHNYDGGIMITASHLPVNRNGAKFFTENGGMTKKDISWLLNRAAEVGHTKYFHLHVALEACLLLLTNHNPCCFISILTDS